MYVLDQTLLVCVVCLYIFEFESFIFGVFGVECFDEWMFQQDGFTLMRVKKGCWVWNCVSVCVCSIQWKIKFRKMWNILSDTSQKIMTITQTAIYSIIGRRVVFIYTPPRHLKYKLPAAVEMKTQTRQLLGQLFRLLSQQH